MPSLEDIVFAHELLAMLSPRSRRIMWNKARGIIEREIAEDEGVSTVRINQIVHKSIRKMRAKAMNNGDQA